MYSEKRSVENCLSSSLKVVKMYEWLLDLYVLDFFVDNHWEKLPVSWQENFANLDPLEIGKILLGTPTLHVFPLSFLALLSSVKAFNIPRNSSNSDYKTKVQDECDMDSCKNHPRLKNLFLKHVKLKKRHEISLMADVVADVVKETGCNAVIDFGSGVGHLVRMLAYRNDVHAVGIECQQALTEEARKLDLELEYTASKHLSKEAVENLIRPTHFNVTLSCHSQLCQLPLPNIMDKYGLIGLHPCGDLGPLLLRHFINYDHVKFICLVGCCFMKLTCRGESCGYPMSNYVKSKDHDLSYVSREIACHAIEVYAERLMKGNYEDLKVHAYRAALEKILVEYDPQLKHSPVRSVKHSDTMTFEKYCTLAVEKLNLPMLLTPETLSRCTSDLEHWRRVVTVYSLRLAIAPLVETVILLDRVLYVLEQGLSCEIRPVFDPKLSPRNHIIIARR